ncbi:MAG: 2-dehydropantoate 2-reductase [Muribaculaceae bacterium]|nr:2-dehydropantoate 2-reductase [Muribaculaceae bacterium]
MSKYLIIGTGGVGGSIAGFLALGGYDVECIARGKHLEAIRQNGLHLKSDLKGEHHINIPAYSAEEYNNTPDVIIVCVKQYSLDSIKDLLNRVATKDTIILPILNIYGTGDKIEKIAPKFHIIDGCIYIVGFVSGVGEITQMGKVFNLIFGAREGKPVDNNRLNEISTTLDNCGIHNTVSHHIEAATFTKWSFISAMACTGAYYDTTMRAIQHEGEERKMFTNLSYESAELASKIGIKGIANKEDMLKAHLAVMDKLDPESTASMQKDLAKGHQSEIKGMLFDMLELGKAYNLDMPTYGLVASKFEKYK